MGLYYFKAIQEAEWKFIYPDVKEELVSRLSKENSELTAETTLVELSKIYEIKKRFNEALKQRIENAPNITDAKEEFKKELINSLDADLDSISKYRQIGYSNAKKGIPLKLKNLGYLLVHKLMEQKSDGDEFIDFKVKPLLKFVLEPLAEGVGLAFFLNDIESNRIDKSKEIAHVNNDKPSEDLRDKLKKHYLGLTFAQVDEFYKYFNDFIFNDITFDEYLICFDLDKPIKKHPTFVNGNMAKFVNFLAGLKTFTMNNEIAEGRFGVKNYKQSNTQGLGNTKENKVFKSRIEAIYKLNGIEINFGK